MQNNFNGVKDLITLFARGIAALEEKTGKSDTELLEDPKVIDQLRMDALRDKTQFRRVEAILRRPEIKELEVTREDGSRVLFAEAVQEQIDQMSSIMEQLPKIMQEQEKRLERINALQEQQKQLQAAKEKQIEFLTQAAAKQLSHFF